MPLIVTEGDVVRRNKRWVWIRIPHPSGQATRILTMPRDFLPHGMATAERVLLEFEEDSYRHDGHAFVVDGRIVKELS
jgi:hypothetical protein